MLPGVVIAATATLVLGVVLGPEAPLVAIGGGLVMLVTARGKLSGNMQARTLLATAGSAAAISAIFGNPLVAVVLMLEIVGLAGSQVMLVLLPCMLSAGVGAIISPASTPGPASTHPRSASPAWPRLPWTAPT